MGLYSKGDRAESAQIGRLEKKVSSLEKSDCYTKIESDIKYLNNTTNVAVDPGDAVGTTIADLRAEVNTLLANLRTAGLIK